VVHPTDHTHVVMQLRFCAAEHREERTLPPSLDKEVDDGQRCLNRIIDISSVCQV
jgi:hypothetical protein